MTESTTLKSEEDLSKEELLKLLAQARSQAQKSDDDAKKAKAESEKIKARAEKNKVQAEKASALIKSLKAKNTEVQQKLDKANDQLAIIGEQIYIGLMNASELATDLNKRAFVVSEVMLQEIAEQVHFAMDEWQGWMIQAKAWFLETPYGKTGPDVKKIKKDTEQVKDDNTKLMGSMQHSAKMLNKLSQNYRKVLESSGLLADADKSEAQIAATEIANTIPPKPATPETPKINEGRKAKRRPVNKVTKAKNNKHICSVCGGKTAPLGELIDTLIETRHNVDDFLKIAENHHELEICQDCGHANITISEEQDFPVVPNRTIGCNLMLHCVESICMGQPLTRVTQAIRQNMELGNDTLYYNLADFTDIYLKPLYKFIQNTARDADAIVADGTPFPCMEAMGKRDCKTNKALKEQGQDVESHSKNYVLSITSVPYTTSKFAYFSFLHSRSEEEIKKVISKDYKFRLLVSDAYGGYDKLIKEEHPEAKLQNCLIHARREIIKAFNPNDYVKKLEPLSEAEQLDLLREDVKNSRPKFLLYMAFDAIDKIYALERSVNRESADALEQRLAVRQTSRKLMENIDKLIEELSFGRVMFKGNKWQAAKSADQYTKVCVYWKNNCDKLKVFLDEPTIPADSNEVESQIRPLTIMRKNVYWIASIKGMDKMCILYSLWETAKKNGMTIGMLENWLRKYCRALYKYCFEKNWTEALKEGKDYTKKLQNWDMEALSEGFNFQEWNLLTEEGRNHV